MTDLHLLSLLKSLCSGQDDALLASGTENREKIIDFLNQSGLTYTMARRIWLDPASYLGQFSELPINVKKALAESAAFYDKEYFLENRIFLRNYVLMPIWRFGHLFLSAGARIRDRNRKKEWRAADFHKFVIMKLLFNIGTILTKGTFRLTKKAFAYLRFTRVYQQPFFYAFWQYLNVDIPRLTYDYIEKTPMDTATGAVWRKPEEVAESVMLLGFDFISSGGRLYFIEANFNAGFGRERLAIYGNGQDPVGKTLIAYASAQGIANIRIYGHNESSYYNPETELTWRNIAKNENIKLEVIDDIFSGSLCSRKKKLVPELSERTLNVLVRTPLNAALIKLIAEKGNLEDFFKTEELWPHEDCVSMPSIFNGGTIANGSNDPRFPKIIIKQKTKDDAEGIVLLNSFEAPDEFKRDDYIISQFLAPDLIRIDTDGKISEFVYKIRSIIIMTVNGPVYLGSYILRSATPVPDCLPEGVVEDISPFIANYSYGGFYQDVTKKEDQACRDASLAVGNGIDQFIKRKYLFPYAYAV